MVFLIAIVVGVYFGLKKSAIVINNNSLSQKNNINAGNPIDSHKNKVSKNLIPIEKAGQNNNQNKNTATILRIIKDATIDFWVFGKENASSSEYDYSVVYINGKNEVVSRNLNSGDKKKLSVTPNNKKPVKVVANSDGSFAAIKFNDGSWSLFDYKNNTWEDFGDDIESVCFSPSGGELAYIKNVVGGIDVYLYNFSSAKIKLTLIFKASLLDYKIIWPYNSELLLIPSPSAMASGAVLSLNIKNGMVFKKFSGSGVILNFGNNGFGVLSNTLNNKLISRIIDNKFNTVYNFNSNMSVLPFKCDFYDDFIFCADSNFNYDGNSHLIPDDYLSGSIYSHDSIYRFDSSNNMDKKMVIDGNKYKFDVTKIKALSDGEVLFRNRFDGGVYEVKIF